MNKNKQYPYFKQKLMNQKRPESNNKNYWWTKKIEQQKEKKNLNTR